MAKTAEGLDRLYNHARDRDNRLWQLIHGDIKPGNLILTKSGIKIIDFGLARSALEPRDWNPIKPLGSDSAAGTPGYRAPELILGFQPKSPASDVYSLGVTLLALIINNINLPSTERLLNKDLENVIYTCLQQHHATQLIQSRTVSDKVYREIAKYLSRMLCPTSQERPAAAHVAAFLHTLAQTIPGQSLAEFTMSASYTKKQDAYKHLQTKRSAATLPSPVTLHR